MTKTAALTMLLIALALAAPGAAAEPGLQGQLGFEERVAAQRAIEEVYWRQRNWPEHNPGPKPELAEVMSEDTIRLKVEDYLKQSNVLENRWRLRVTSEQLQAELQRMSQQTRDPELLRSLYAALGNDPFLIAETLARRTLVDRLIRERYAADDRLHAGVRQEAERALASLRSVEEMKTLGGAYVERSFTRHDDTTDELGPADWEELTQALAERFETTADAIPVGQVSRLQEESDRFVVTAVLSIDADGLTVASTTWPKRSFGAWWSQERGATSAVVAVESGAYEMTAPSSGGCVDDTWEEKFYAPVARRGHTAVWTGVEMIVWGGAGALETFRSGGRYNPATDSWTATSTGTDVPAARTAHTAVWTGTEMIVWGGNPLANSGGRYDPMTDSWTATSTGTDVPEARAHHTAVWTGTEMIVWGGIGNTGGRYNPTTDAWAPTSTGVGVPATALGTAVWTGTEMIVWGSSTTNTGSRYDPATDSWVATSTGLGTPLPRNGHTAVWTGTEMIVWGGRDSGFVAVNTGGRYDPTTNGWTPTSTGGPVPSPRCGHSVVWSGTEMIVWGGDETACFSVGVGSDTGGRYDPMADSWTATPTGGNVPSKRYWHTAVWSGTEMIVWGGRSFDGATFEFNTGGRYDPVAGDWTATATGPNVPSARLYHSAVWTGAELIVWGGQELGSSDALDTGGRYVPATDSWTATSTGAGVPAPRSLHEAVWSGTEMIVWGGFDGVGALFDTGGRYDPAADSWTPTSTGPNLPSDRAVHTAVWTGTEMIVWGGRDFGGHLNTGGRYDPVADSWAATSTGTNVPEARDLHSRVWTGTEMIVWGGRNSADTSLDTGARYDPVADGWTSTSVGAGVPTARQSPTAVWTGREMIVWGGSPSGSLDATNTGGRYDPATDGWTATSTGTDLPSERQTHTAVWTGSEMIVWGGYNGDFYSTMNTGGRYDPAVDGWTATSSTESTPAVRRGHTAAWTGAEMIVWGGNPRSSNLAIYCATSPASPGVVSNLLLERSGTDLLLSWSGDCGFGDRYGIYRGDLALGYGSNAIDQCGVGATEATIAMGAPDGEFFLVVPEWSAQEGSYGTATAGERAPATSACRPQGFIDECAP